MKNLPIYIFPGLLGAIAIQQVYHNLNTPNLPVEYEASIAVVFGLFIFLLTTKAVNWISQKESLAQTFLEEAGIDPTHIALRTAQLVENAAKRIEAMQNVTKGRKPELIKAFTIFKEKMSDLMQDIIQTPDTARRADDLLKRTLPRLEQSFIDYCHYAQKGDGVIDTNETRERLIEALLQTSQIADDTRKAVMESSQNNVEASLSVLETTIAHPR